MSLRSLISPTSYSATLTDRASIVSGSSGGTHKLNDDGKPNYYIDLKNQGQQLIKPNITRNTHFYESKVQFNWHENRN